MTADRHTTRGDDADRPDEIHPDGEHPVEEAVEETETLLAQMGGISGLIYSSVPIVVFVPANSLWGLTAAIYSALGVATLILLIRVIRRDRLQPAISGFIGVAVCAFIAHRTGDAKGYFLFGIWTTLLYAGVFILSVLVRWPLVGVIWNAVNGNGTDWRRNRRVLIAYDLATVAWAVVFAARYLVQSSLYDDDQTGALAVARIAMGWPLTGLAVLATVLLVRRAERVPEAGLPVAEQVAAGQPGADRPVTGESVSDLAAPDRSVADQPVADESGRLSLRKSAPATDSGRRDRGA